MQIGDLVVVEPYKLSDKRYIAIVVGLPRDEDNRLLRKCYKIRHFDGTTRWIDRDMMWKLDA